MCRTPFSFLKILKVDIRKSTIFHTLYHKFKIIFADILMNIINKKGHFFVEFPTLTRIKNGINFITNLPERLTDCDFKEKQKIIGSIFPEKLQFDGKKVRTAFGQILKN